MDFRCLIGFLLASAGHGIELVLGGRRGTGGARRAAAGKTWSPAGSAGRIYKGTFQAVVLGVMLAASSYAAQPNVVFIFADDIATKILGAYGGSLIETPNIDRLAKEGMRFQNAFCTNSICTPARATVLTGKYSNNNGIKTLDIALGKI